MSRAGMLLAVAVLLAGCGGGGTAETETAPPTTVTQPPAATAALDVYFMRGDRIGAAHRDVAATPRLGSAAVAALLAGPTELERAAGLHSEIPAGTKLLGLTIGGGTATVDLSGDFASGGGSLSMQARVAQVVYTLTQFPSVRQVAFRLDGKPVDAIGGEGVLVNPPTGRADWEDLTPPILVESPAPGETVSSPLRVRGTANTFEATLQLAVRGRGGRKLVEKTVTATSGSGTRGTFAATLPVDAPAGPVTLVAFEYSAADGSVVHEVEIPLELAKQ